MDYAKEYDRLVELSNTQQARIETLEDAFRKLQQWASAYPVSVFPEPDFARAHEVLKYAGMTLDAISASNMRHVLKGIEGIVEAALNASE